MPLYRRSQSLRLRDTKITELETRLVDADGRIRRAGAAQADLRKKLVDVEAAQRRAASSETTNAPIRRSPLSQKPSRPLRPWEVANRETDYLIVPKWTLIQNAHERDDIHIRAQQTFEELPQELADDNHPRIASQMRMFFREAPALLRELAHGTADRIVATPKRMRQDDQQKLDSLNMALKDSLESLKDISTKDAKALDEYCTENHELFSRWARYLMESLDSLSIE